jgi:hypothetical protein
LVKLIPAEVVALYLTFKEVASSWLSIWAWICLALVVLVRCFGTYNNAKSVQRSRDPMGSMKEGSKMIE